MWISNVGFTPLNLNKLETGGATERHGRAALRGYPRKSGVDRPKDLLRFCLVKKTL